MRYLAWIGGRLSFFRREQWLRRFGGIRSGSIDLLPAEDDRGRFFFREGAVPPVFHEVFLVFSNIIVLTYLVPHRPVREQISRHSVLSRPTSPRACSLTPRAYHVPHRPVRYSKERYFSFPMRCSAPSSWTISWRCGRRAAGNWWIAARSWCRRAGRESAICGGSLSRRIMRNFGTETGDFSCQTCHGMNIMVVSDTNDHVHTVVARLAVIA